MRVCGRNISQTKITKRSFGRTASNWLKIPQIPPFLGIFFTLLLKSGAGFHAIASGSHYFWPPWPWKMLSWDIGHIPQGLPQLWAPGEPEVKCYPLNLQSTRCCPADSSPLWGGSKAVEGHAERSPAIDMERERLLGGTTPLHVMENFTRRL